MLQKSMWKLRDTSVMSALLGGLAVLGLQSGILPLRTLDVTGHHLAAVTWAHAGDSAPLMRAGDRADNRALPFLIFVQNQTIDLTGDWQLTVNGPFGNRHLVLHIDQRGSRLQGNAEGRQISGTIRGDQVDFTIKAPLGHTLTLTGTVADGRMQGITNMGRPWTASR
jgi:hypothetical protein